MKPEIELIYDADCLNAPAARSVLREALERSGLESRWVEHDRSALRAPERTLRYGSPTILVDGVDVAGESAEALAACCRVYADPQGLRGVPSLETVLAAITRRKPNG